jgi:hypothetical protein
VLELRVAGDVTDYSASVLDQIARTIATLLDVQLSQVSASAEAASVHVVVTVAAASDADASSNAATLEAQMTSPEDATMFFSAGGVALTVATTPVVRAISQSLTVVTPSPPTSPSPTGAGSTDSEEDDDMDSDAQVQPKADVSAISETPSELSTTLAIAIGVPSVVLLLMSSLVCRSWAQARRRRLAAPSAAEVRMWKKPSGARCAPAPSSPAVNSVSATPSTSELAAIVDVQ